MPRSNHPPTHVPISLQPELPHTYLPIPNPHHHMPTPATLICPTISLSKCLPASTQYFPHTPMPTPPFCCATHLYPLPLTILPHAYLCHPNTPNHTPTSLVPTCPSIGLHTKPKPNPLSASPQLALPHTYAFHPNPPHVYMAHPNMPRNKPTCVA